MAAPPPMPRSPPKYPDFCGRRRLQLEVQVMNRELGFLEEELQSLDRLQPASICCKEVNEFVGANPDPLIPIKKKRGGSCRIWKWLRSKLCFISSSICCYSSGCSLGLERPSCGCLDPTYWFCCDCQCGCHRCSCCEVSCCWPSWCWNWCCSKASCCGPRCCPSDVTCCKAPSSCCCCCRDVSCCRPRCCLPSLSCPGYSCGCVWSCPRCTGVQLCPTCTKTSCISGCEC